VKEGNDATQCETLKQSTLDACLADCGAAPDVTCPEECEGTAQDKHDTVLETTDNEGKATRKGMKVFRHCSRSCGADN
jgi:hypothetical protein